MKATLPVYLAVARRRWVGSQTWRGAARPADTAQSRLLTRPLRLPILRRNVRPRPYLRHLPRDYLLATCAGCGRLFSWSRVWDARPARPG